MRICPSGHCLCHTVQMESIRIWGDLQDAQNYQSPIHEDTITQTLALNLNREHGGQSRVHVFSRPEEAKNGSDFIWIFFSPDLSRHIRLVIQAKRLYPSGSYEAFKKNQAIRMRNYAYGIGAVPVYVFYNFIPFLRAYNVLGGRDRYWHRYMLISNCMRHFGSIYVRTEDILNLTGSSISANEIVNVFRPLWHPFCVCDGPRRACVLENFAERFNAKSDKETNDTPEILKTGESLQRWMLGERTDSLTIEDFMMSREDQPSEGFAPSFVMGTRLTDSD